MLIALLTGGTIAASFGASIGFRVSIGAGAGGSSFLDAGLGTTAGLARNPKAPANFLTALTGNTVLISTSFLGGFSGLVAGRVVASNNPLRGVLEFPLRVLSPIFFF